MKFQATWRARDIVGGGALALALTLGGSTAGLADSPAKVDHSRPNAAPVYPDTAQYAGEQGDVLVDVQVSASGHPHRFRIKQSSGFQDLDMAAMDTAANWHYIPAVVDGDTATAWTTVKIHYELPQPTGAAAALPADEHELNDHCARPVAPAAIDGAVATEAELASARENLQDFLKTSDRYQVCLRRYVGGQEDLAMFVKTTVPEWIRKGVETRIAQNQKDKEAAGARYNEAALTYKAKHGQ